MTQMNGWIKPTCIFDGNDLLSGHAVRIEDGNLVQIMPVDEMPNTASAVDLSGILTPGFVDLQVNGGGGVLLNNQPSHQTMRQILRAHRRYGTVAVLPTVITDTHEVLHAAVDAALEAKEEAGIIGLHIEGPHLAISRRGTHAKEHIRPFDSETLGLVKKLRDSDIPVMITVAPEIVGKTVISDLAEMGAVVSIGHTNATAEEGRMALAEGARCFTHLFNAMPPMINRDPGVVAAAINSDAYAGIICDGYHVSDDLIKMALRARPCPDRMFVISDAMPTISGPEHFKLYNAEVKIKGGRLINSQGNLAGAHITISQSVKRLIENIGLSPSEALRMAISVPAAVIGKPELGLLLNRPIGDLIILKDNFEFDKFAF
ncbi:MAG: N-acetylglucosamine-6-phosphate deacetylase [Paracoccaceae bacterium]|nr:N-acetylglucosamine-6-phosphate deacetylase [Paracoccaceae bacterium]